METQHKGRRERRGCGAVRGGFTLLEVVAGLGLLVMLVAGALALWRTGEHLRMRGLIARQSAELIPEIRERFAELAPGSVLLVEKEGSDWLVREFPGRDWLPPDWRGSGRLWGMERKEASGGLVRWEFWEELVPGRRDIRFTYYETLQREP